MERTSQGQSPNSQLRLWGPVAAYMLLIFLASSFERLPTIGGGLSDKHLHALAYAGLALLTFRAFADARFDRLTAARGLAAVVVAVVYGISDEWHQHFVPGRTSDVLDLLADAAGAILAVGLLWACGIIRRFSLVRRV
jgi:VanZ family protein